MTYKKSWLALLLGIGLLFQCPNGFNVQIDFKADDSVQMAHVMAATSESTKKNKQATEVTTGSSLVTSPPLIETTKVSVGDLKQVNSIYYKVTSTKADKRTVCVIGFNEDEASISFVNSIVLQGELYKVTAVDSYAFFGCQSLYGAVDLGKVKTVGAYAFYDCINVTEIKIGSKVTTIGKRAFYGCKQVKKVRLQEASSLTKVGPQAFYELSPQARLYYSNRRVKKLLKNRYNDGRLVKTKVILF